MSDNVFSIGTRRLVSEEMSEEQQAELKEKEVLKENCLEILEDLKGLIESGQIQAFSFIGFSEQNNNDVTVTTLGCFKNSAATVGAMIMHLDDFKATVYEASDYEEL